MSVKNIAIILAGGSGIRFGGGTPKQFEILDGKEIIDYSLKVFFDHDAIDDIIIVSHKNWIKKLKKKYNNCIIVEGGNTRKESSYLGLKACPENTKNVLIHDASRPFISNAIISSCIKSLEDYSAVNLSYPTKDSVSYIKNNMVDSMLDRKNIYLNQTPQSFRYEVILNAHEKFPNINATDDITIAKNADVKVYNLKGDRDNIKITYKEDLKIGKMIINKQNKEII